VLLQPGEYPSISLSLKEKMKKLILFVVSILTFNVSAQNAESDYSIVVADVDIMKIEGVEYIELVGSQKLMSFEVNVFVDYGQKTQLFGKVQTIRDDSKGTFANGTGMNKDFKSMIDALNFFNSRGWEYVNQYVVTSTSTNVYHILLKRKR
jgi:hypothetical protein